jgi:hypothetical protein
LSNIEEIRFTDRTTNISITTKDGLVAADATLTLDASSLTSSAKLTFDGSAETNGNFKVTGGLTAGISSYLTSFLSDPLSGASTDVTYYAADNHGPNNNLYQGILGPGAGQPVPEPATMAVLGLGALMLRRRSKKA